MSVDISVGNGGTAMMGGCGDAAEDGGYTESTGDRGRR